MSKHFLQSKGWEGFQGALGRKVWRVDDALVIKFPLALGKSYLYSAGSAAAPSLGGIKNIAKQENAVFFKFEPLVGDQRLVENLIKAGFVKSTKEIQPQRTIMVDITRSEEQILAGMREKTRYNIRLARKKDLRFKIYDLRIENKASEEFWQLLQKTSRRDNFYTHSKEYYKNLLDLSSAKLFAVEYQSKIISANITLFYEKRAIYLHGASDYKYRNLMAPYLLHWEIIKYTKARGFSEYDLRGIDEKKWPGVTRFKQGFRGTEINYIGSYDYIFQPFWYALYKIRQSLKKTT